MQSSQSIAERVNSVIVTKEDLWELARDSEQFHRSEVSDVGMEVGIALIANRHSGNFEKASAIFFRMAVLARLLEDEGAPGWTLPALPNGGIPTEAAVFAAAAVQPLIESDNDLVFERTGFLDRVLELAECEGRA